MISRRLTFAFAAACILSIPMPASAQNLSKDEVTRLVTQAMNAVAQGRHGDAVDLYEKVLPSAERIYGKDQNYVAIVVNNLAENYRHTGQYAKAESLHLRSLRTREALYGKDHPDVAESLNNLANVYVATSQFVKAEPLYVRSLQIREAKLGKNHFEVGQTIDNLAILYWHMGQHARTEPLYLRGLQVREAALGKDHPLVAHSLNNLAVLYNRTGQSAKVESLLQRCLQIRETKLGRDHPDVADTLNNLAEHYIRLGQFAKAEPLFLRCLQIREARQGTLHPSLADVLNNLAHLYRLTAQYEKAEPLLQRSLKIREAVFGKGQTVAQSLTNLALNSAGLKDWTKAIERTQIARQAHANHFAEMLPILSEKEQLELLENTSAEWPFYQALSLGWCAPKEAAAASAEWLLNGKALTHQSLAEQHLLARDAGDAKSKALTHALRQTRNSLATLVNRMPAPGREKEYQREVQDLKTREQDLAQQLARLVGRPFRANPWITLDEVRAKLGPNTAFVDIARFELFDFNTDVQKEFRYVAWITPPKGKGDVQLIDLGAAKAIDKLVEETRKTLIESAQSVGKDGETAAVEALRTPLQALSARVLHPLLPALANYEEWIVSPDGALWLTPWNALLLNDGTYAVEKFQIRHVVSGRDLVLDLPKVKAESAYVFADPDYDLTPGKAMRASGLRGLASPLLGQRLRGVIAAWNVSFEFLEGEVIIYDEDAGGAVAGKGTWNHEGDSLTIQTELSQFDGVLASGEIRGHRGKRIPDGRSRDAFRITLPDDDTRAVSASKTLPRVARLPGTAVEAESVRPHIQKWLDAEPKIYLDEKAGESLVKSVKNTRLLVLATHGYFLPARNVADTSGQPIENPLLRCGLLLAGCNKRAEAKAGEDDGILTGLEIVGMDLRGTELVVLSACETGLGDVRSGEGVAGLRQAFQLAGAKGVLASLWQVPDRETALLMNAFYGDLMKGKTQAAALRDAQLSRIAARKTSFGAAHPFFWAAFTLTSRGAE